MCQVTRWTCWFPRSIRPTLAGRQAPANCRSTIKTTERVKTAKMTNCLWSQMKRAPPLPRTAVDPFIHRTCLLRWATSSELRCLSTSSALTTTSSSNRPLSQHRNGGSNIPQRRTFQTRISQKLTTSETSTATISPDQCATKANAAHATPLPSCRLSKQGWNLSMANRFQFYLRNKYCSAISWTRAAKVVGLI